MKNLLKTLPRYVCDGISNRRRQLQQQAASPVKRHDQLKNLMIKPQQLPCMYVCLNSENFNNSNARNRLM